MAEGTDPLFVNWRTGVPTPVLPPLNFGVITSAMSNLDILFTNIIGYRILKIALISVVPVTDGAGFFMRVSSDGGVNFDSGASDYEWAFFRVRSSTASTVDGSSADNLIGIVRSADGVPNDPVFGGLNCEVTIMDYENTARHPQVYIDGSYVEANFGPDSQVVFYSSGRRVAAQKTNAVRFSFVGSDILSAKWAVYSYA